MDKPVTGSVARKVGRIAAVVLVVVATAAAIGLGTSSADPHQSGLRDQGGPRAAARAAAAPAAGPQCPHTVVHTGAPVPSPPGLFLLYYIDGVSTISKLGDNMVIGSPQFGDRGEFDAFVDLASGKITGYLYLPYSAGTFLGFRFLPATACAQFLPSGPQTGVFQGNLNLTTNVNIQLSNAIVNGTPLDVGSACQTESPVSITLNGPLQLAPDSVSKFTTNVKIPNFAGCGATENLNPLFDGLISTPKDAVNPVTLSLTLHCSGLVDPVNCKPHP
jgi:hypothetical protein